MSSNTPNMNVNVNMNMIRRNFRLLIRQVRDVSTRQLMEQEFERAFRDKRLQQVQDIWNRLQDYLENGRADHVDEISKDIKYDKPPTMIQAVMDFLLLNCADIDKINEDDMEATIQVPCTNPGGNGGKGYGNCKGGNGRNKTMKITRRQLQLIEGKTQVGKTNFIVSAAIRSMVLGFTPIMVVRNFKGDANQLQNSLARTLTSLVKFLDVNQATNRTINFQESIMTIDERMTKQTIHQILDGINNKFLILLGNDTQLERLWEAVEEKPGTYDIMIDEVDDLDYGDSNTAKCLLKFKEAAHQVFAITATPFDTIFSEQGLMVSGCISITPPPDYRGFEDIRYRYLKYENSSFEHEISYDTMLKEDKNLKSFLNEYVKREPMPMMRYDELHPNILLIKNSSIVENHKTLAAGINKDYPNVPTIVSNQHGINMYVKGVNNFMVGKREVVIGTPNKHIEVPDALQFLRENGGVKKYPHIIIIAGNIAGRCISFVARDYRWHTTDMYYAAAKTTSVANLIQAAGRLTGRNKRMADITLHGHEKMIQCLFAGYRSKCELIQRAISDTIMDSINREEDIQMAVKISSIPLNTAKFPVLNGRKLTNKASVKRENFNILKKHEDDRGWDMDKYKYMIVQDLEMPKAEPETTTGTVRIPSEEFIRLTGKMFPKWSKENSRIANFMHNLDPNKIYTKKEIVRQMNQIQDVTEFKYGNGRKGSGMIMQNVGSDMYRLYPELVTSFKRYF